LDVIDYPRRGFSLDAHKRANNWPPNKKKKKTKKEKKMRKLRPYITN